MTTATPEVQMARLADARTRATERLLGSPLELEQLAELAGVDPMALRVFSKHCQEAAEAMGTSHAASFAAGFLTALELVAELDPANCERCGGTPDGNAHERWCDRD